MSLFAPRDPAFPLADRPRRRRPARALLPGALLALLTLLVGCSQNPQANLPDGPPVPLLVQVAETPLDELQRTQTDEDVVEFNLFVSRVELLFDDGAVTLQEYPAVDPLRVDLLPLREPPPERIADTTLPAADYGSVRLRLVLARVSLTLCEPAVGEEPPRCREEALGDVAGNTGDLRVVSGEFQLQLPSDTPPQEVRIQIDIDAARSAPSTNDDGETVYFFQPQTHTTVSITP